MLYEGMLKQKSSFIKTVTNNFGISEETAEYAFEHFNDLSQEEKKKQYIEALQEDIKYHSTPSKMSAGDIVLMLKEKLENVMWNLQSEKDIFDEPKGWDTTWYEVVLNDGTKAEVMTFNDENGYGEVIPHVIFSDETINDKYSIDDIVKWREK